MDKSTRALYEKREILRWDLAHNQNRLKLLMGAQPKEGKQLQHQSSIQRYKHEAALMVQEIDQLNRALADYDEEVRMYENAAIATR